MNKSVFLCLFVSSLQSTNKVFKMQTEKKTNVLWTMEWHVRIFCWLLIWICFFISFAKCYERRINQNIKIIAFVCCANNKILSLKWFLRFEFCQNKNKNKNKTLKSFNDKNNNIWIPFDRSNIRVNKSVVWLMFDVYLGKI